jgi:hypothetical protein
MQVENLIHRVIRGGPIGKRHQPVGDPGDGRTHDQHLVTFSAAFPRQIGNGFPLRPPGHAGAAEFQYDPSCRHVRRTPVYAISTGAGTLTDAGCTVQPATRPARTFSCGRPRGALFVRPAKKNGAITMAP